MDVRVYDWLAHHAGNTPTGVAAVDVHRGRRLTWADFDERARRLASVLRDDLGVRRGDRVGVLSPNTTDVFELQFACAKLGAVFLPLNWRLAVPELQFIVGDATPSVLVHDVEFADTAAALASAAGIKHLVAWGGPTSAVPYEEALAVATGDVEAPPLTHDDVWTVMYTSGTTGRPKGAVITHGMTFWNAVNLGMAVDLTRRAVCLTVLPLFHTAGLNCYANPAFHVGATVVVMRSFDAGAALALIGDPDQGITHFFGVPANYLFMSQHPDFERTDLSRLACAGVGGAPTPLALLETWAARGVALVQGYGMTETSPTVTVMLPEHAVAKVGSAGRAALHTEVRIVDEDGCDVPRGQVGELWVRGPNVTPGYWNRPEATAEAITDGWLHTGDAAREDEDGFYSIVDRWKDMYISGGENVYPAEVEDVIYQLPAVGEVAVIGVPDERWGEVGCAVVVPRPGTVLTEEEVIGHCRGRLAKFKVPVSVVFTEELPHNATGKVLKRELRARYHPAG